MKCLSCERNIDPQCSHAIDANVCPYCGKNIMEEHLKNLLVTLKSTMDSLANYPDQLNDWLLSNYNYIKTDSPQLYNYASKKAVKDVTKDNVTATIEEGTVEKKSEDRTAVFFKRAEVKNTVDKTEHLKKMAEQIKQAGAGSAEDWAVALSPPEINSDEEVSPSDFNSLFSNTLPIDTSESEESDEIPAVVLSMANGKMNTDMLKLQNQVSKAKSARGTMESGATRGKGGFSRV